MPLSFYIIHNEKPLTGIQRDGQMDCHIARSKSYECERREAFPYHMAQLEDICSPFVSMCVRVSMCSIACDKIN